jgi:uncharacterized protein YxjI
MRYTLKHKLFSLGHDSIIKDSGGRDVYIVDGAAIAIGRHIKIKDMHGQELASIHQELIALTPTYEIKMEGGLSAKASMKLLSLTDRLKFDVPGPDDFEARGNLFHREYAIAKGSREVAHVSKRWISLTDSYGIEIDDDQNQVFLLACAVVIDEILELRERGEKE